MAREDHVEAWDRSQMERCILHALGPRRRVDPGMAQRDQDIALGAQARHQLPGGKYDVGGLKLAL